MNRRFLLLIVPVVVALSAILGGLAAPQQAAQAQSAAQGLTLYQSQPDQVVLYLGDLAYLRDELTLPPGEEAYLLLPATTVPPSLVITENGQRVRSYRVLNATEVAATTTLAVPWNAVPWNAALSSTASASSGQPLLVTWGAPPGDEPRQVVLEYLATGAGWEPIYDMAVLDEEQVLFGFDAEIRNTALPLDGAAVRLAAGMPGAQPGYQPDMTVTQANVGYEMPAGAVSGPVEINHVYDIGAQTFPQGGVTRWNLVYETLAARRLLVWDARVGQRVDVIYRVQNTTDVPFVAGMVRAYGEGLYIGDDRLEWTPGGSEGSVTVAGLSAVRVRRTLSTEAVDIYGDRYRHDVRLDLTNHGGEELDLIVLDEWNRAGLDFTFSHEPQRQGNNVLRWELTLPAGEQVVVEYTFYTD